MLSDLYEVERFDVAVKEKTERDTFTSVRHLMLNTASRSGLAMIGNELGIMYAYDQSLVSRSKAHSWLLMT